MHQAVVTQNKDVGLPPPPPCDNQVSFGTVNYDCVLGECDTVISIKNRPNTYQVLLKAWHDMSRDREIRREIGDGKITGTR